MVTIFGSASVYYAPVSIVGVGLLLDQSSVGRLSEFRERWRGTLLGAPFGTSENAPHITLYQFPVNATQVPELPLHIPRQSVTWGELLWQPTDWAFATTLTDSWIVDPQRYVMRQLFEFMDPYQLRRKDELVGYTPSEKLQYLATGYRYSGESFRPHVTMGRLAIPIRETFLDAVSDFSRMFAGTTAMCERAVLYRAGARGSISRVLATD